MTADGYTQPQSLGPRSSGARTPLTLDDAVKAPVLSTLPPGFGKLVPASVGIRHSRIPAETKHAAGLPANAVDG